MPIRYKHCHKKDLFFPYRVQIKDDAQKEREINKLYQSFSLTFLFTFECNVRDDGSFYKKKNKKKEKRKT